MKNSCNRLISQYFNTTENPKEPKFVTSYTELGIELPNPDWLKDWIGTKDYIEIHASFNSSSFVGAERLLK